MNPRERIRAQWHEVMRLGEKTSEQIKRKCLNQNIPRNLVIKYRKVSQGLGNNLNGYSQRANQAVVRCKNRSLIL